MFFWISHNNLVSLIEAPYKKVESFSYTPYYGYEKKVLSPKQIENDLNLLSPITNKIRTYSSKDAKVVLEATSEKILPIDLGIWLSNDYKENYEEIQIALKLLKTYPNSIENIIVGNEVLLREDLNEIELFAYINFLKEFTDKPITTAETWDRWIKFPDLANHVDFITIHILPYWEKISIENFDNFILKSYASIKNLFPNKKIYIGEIGWPSHGYNNNKAIPSLENQAKAIRGFVNLAKKNNWSYNIIEAFDQPWKGYDEGNIGQYWGIFDANRKLKFNLEGAIETNQYWFYQMIGAILIGALLTFFGLRYKRLNLNHTLAYAIVAQGMGFGIVMALIYPFINYPGLCNRKSA